MGDIDVIALAVHTEYDGGTVTHKVGGKHLETNVSPPYVVWVQQSPVGADYSRLRPGPRATGTPNEVSKACVNRVVTAHIYVWADDFDSAETLVKGLIAAAHRYASSSVRYRGEQWPKQDVHEQLKRGEPAILRLEFDCPVAGETWETVEVVAANPPTKDFVESL